MSGHPIEGLMDVTLEKIRSIVDVNTIIGDPIKTEQGITLIPVSKVSFGFASGGSDFPTKNPEKCFGGGSGAGMSIHAIAFIVIKDNDVKIMHVSESDNSIDKAINMVPEVIDKIVATFKKKKDKAPEDM